MKGGTSLWPLDEKRTTWEGSRLGLSVREKLGSGAKTGGAHCKKRLSGSTKVSACKVSRLGPILFIPRPESWRLAINVSLAPVRNILYLI